MYFCGKKHLAGCPGAWLLKKNRKNRKLGIEKIGKIGNFVLKRIKYEKNRKINSTFVDIDDHPAPHQDYNKGQESLAFTFAGFRPTFEA